MPDHELREFVCKHCQHKVVVNPKLPADYTPNICTQCYEQIEKPRALRAQIEIFGKLGDLIRSASRLR